MKTLLIAVTLLAGTFTKSFATGTPVVEPTVLKSFQSTFASATEVAWSTTAQGLYKAVFFLNGQAITAYYNEDGTMQALTRHISVNSLPMLLQTALKNAHKEKWISDVFEVTNDNGLQYYVTLEDANTKVILKSAFNTWSTFQKQRKE